MDVIVALVADNADSAVLVLTEGLMKIHGTDMMLNEPMLSVHLIKKRPQPIQKNSPRPIRRKLQQNNRNPWQK